MLLVFQLSRGEPGADFRDWRKAIRLTFPGAEFSRCFGRSSPRLQGIGTTIHILL